MYTRDDPINPLSERAEHNDMQQCPAFGDSDLESDFEIDFKIIFSPFPGLKWYFTQSSQRKTVEATKPKSSFVCTSKAPSVKALVSKLNMRLSTLLLSAKILSFILER